MHELNNLKDLITDSDLKLYEIAHITGVNPRQVARWLNGTQEMGIFKLKALCKYFNVSADYILELPQGMSRPR